MSTKAMELRHQIGTLLIAGLAGTELTATEQAWLRVIRPAGIILFRRNIESANQTWELLKSATAECGPMALRCVDVEGGLVDRLRDALAPAPAAQAVASTADKRLNRMHGSLIARELKAFGLNTTFAPVLDLGLAESAEVMRTRTAGATPDAVIEYAGAMLQGLAEEQVWGAGKHFPGLGGGTLDSHHATPHIERGPQQLWAEDLKPFRALAKKLPLVMVSHAAYPNTPAGDKPASVSAYWVNEVLKKKLGFRGLVVSDDMEMGGILNYAPMEEAAVEAVLAGIHLIEICKSPELILRAYEALLSEAEKSKAFRSLVGKLCTESLLRRKKAQVEWEPAPASQRTVSRIQKDMEAFTARVEKANA